MVSTTITPLARFDPECFRRGVLQHRDGFHTVHIHVDDGLNTCLESIEDEKGLEPVIRKVPRSEPTSPLEIIETPRIDISGNGQSEPARSWWEHIVVVDGGETAQNILIAHSTELLAPNGVAVEAPVNVPCFRVNIPVTTTSSRRVELVITKSRIILLLAI